MGATKIGDIKEICDIVNPTLGVITSIGPQHLESFKTIDNFIGCLMETNQKSAICLLAELPSLH